MNIMSGPDFGAAQPELWGPLLLLDDDSSRPIYIRLAEALVRRIERGTLPPATRLPGSRRLARLLGINRNTVSAAYRELESQGWIVARARSGFYVNALETESPAANRAGGERPPFPGDLRGRTDGDQGSTVEKSRRPADEGPTAQQHSPFRWPTPLFARATNEPPPRSINASGGLVDVRQIPIDAISRAIRRALRAGGRRLLDYDDAQGSLALRRQLAEMVGVRRGVVATPENVLITRGSQMALYLVARALLRPGDLVAVEAFGYPPAWNAFEAAGGALVPIPIDDSGLCVDVLEPLARTGRLKLAYLTPQHQYPTTVTLHPQRRRQLLELAERYRFAIVEDDYDNEFHYDGRPILPLAASDGAGYVIYVSTFSKILAPGLRLGFVIADRETIARFTALRRVVDRQGDLPLEHALAELIELG
ncbi:MAG: PLP-dependent aminotransferase family protein, partial [Myxococcales bacterium]|nr:PLP-dependent aminotransferase family protein [Myxococcales bacterium]